MYLVSLDPANPYPKILKTLRAMTGLTAGRQWELVGTKTEQKRGRKFPIKIADRARGEPASLPPSSHKKHPYRITFAYHGLRASEGGREAAVEIKGMISLCVNTQ